MLSVGCQEKISFFPIFLHLFKLSFLNLMNLPLKIVRHTAISSIDKIIYRAYNYILMTIVIRTAAAVLKGLYGYQC